jgi:putative spermidine/putrescine transport system substrate-binding protein
MKDSVIGRRSFLQGVAGLSAMAAVPALTACGSGTSRADGAAASTKTLAVRNSGGAYGEALQKGVYEPFTKETGIQVQVVHPQYAQMLAQIKQGRPQFDVIDNSMMDFLKFVRDDGIEKLDFDRLKSFKAANIPSNMVTEHAVGKAYYASVMAYRTDQFGGKKPGSWPDFWDTKAFSGSRSLQHPDADLPELEFALLADGVPMDKLYPIDVDRAFKSLDRIKPSVKKYWDTGNLPGVLLSRKEVVMATCWHGRLSALIKQGVPLAYQFAGARRQGQGYAIPKGAANLDAAYQLIDFSLRPETQANLAKIYPTNPVSAAAFDNLPEDVRANLASSPEYRDLGFDLDPGWWLKNETAVNKRWLEWARV